MNELGRTFRDWVAAQEVAGCVTSVQDDDHIAIKHECMTGQVNFYCFDDMPEVVELAVAESGAILVPSSALPPAGNVAVSVAVEGPFAATTRTVLSGDVVVAVAGAPELAAISSAFAVAEDGVSAVIENAVAGFWYSWEAADTLAGPFLPVGSPVCARFDGELVLTLAEPMRARRFYRLCVTAEP